MARDNFSRAVIDRLAKRAGMRCSNPDCRRPTAGPGADGGTTNLGVAAHITAASPGGPRFDPSLTPERRSDIANGIWLCQVHAKLIDDDELAFPPSLLFEWKETAEHMAALEVRGYAVRKASPFPDLERKAPKLVAEMRNDLERQPLIREFSLLKKPWIYNGDGHPRFAYYYEDHEYLLGIMTIMINAGAIEVVGTGQVRRYNFREDFVSNLLGE